MHHSLPRRLLGVACTAVLTLGLAVPAAAQTTIKLGWTTADSENDPYAIAARYFAEELEKRAPGEFDVQLFPNHELGDDSEMLQGMQLGTLQAGVITGTAVGTVEPAFQLNDLPFLYGSNEQAHEVLDGPVGQSILERLRDDQLVGLGFAEAGFRHAINNERPIRTPEDFDGIKLRVQPSQVFIDSFDAIGANPVPMQWSDVFTAVQQGTVDGLEIPLAVIYANKYPEVTRYLSMTRHSYNALGLLVSQSFYQRLDESRQQLLQEAAQAAIERQRETVAANNEEILEAIREAGMEVNEIEDVEAFRQRVQPVYEEYRDQIGPKLVDAALEAVSE